MRRELCRRFESGEVLLLPPPQRAWGPYRTRIRKLADPTRDLEDSCWVRWRKPPKTKRCGPVAGPAVSPLPAMVPGPVPGSNSLDHTVTHKNTHDGTDPEPGAHQGGSVAETSPGECKRLFFLCCVFWLGCGVGWFWHMRTLPCALVCAIGFNLIVTLFSSGAQ